MQNLLSLIITDDDFEKIELILNEPNIFSALSVQRKEIRHSNFIGYLLDPNETHGLKDLVLRKVLRDIFNLSKNSQRNIFDADTLDYTDVEIRREWRNIDILIILKEDVVVIENKVDSLDHSQQLERYRKIAQKNFEDKKIHCVYLTPNGLDPQDEESKKDYINYSYEMISKIIETILSLYKNSISEKIFFYLSDYQSVLKKELLKMDPLNELARKVYYTHKQAFDFIFENMPDPVNEIHPLFEKELIDAGYVIGSKTRGIVRFNKQELDSLLPRVGSGWRNKEIFSFEIKFIGNVAMFLAVISPGNPEIQNKINSPLTVSKYYKKPSGKKWLVLAKEKYDFFSEESLSEQSEEDIKFKIKKIIKDAEPVVSEFVTLLLNDPEVLKLKELNT